MRLIPWVLGILIVVSSPGLVAQVQTVTLGASKDNTLYEDGSGGLSNGAGQYLFTGETLLNGTRRALIAFDVASAVPAGATVVAAQLTLLMDMTPSLDEPVQLRRVTSDWGEGASNAPGGEGGGDPAQPGDATWLHTFFPGMTWNTVAGDFVPYPSATTAVGAPDFYSWGSNSDLVADVQGWLDSPTTNYGWIVIGTEDGAASAKRFRSRSSPFAGDRPALQVSYVMGVAASAVPTGDGCRIGAAGPLRLRGLGVPSLGNAGFALEVSGGVVGGFGSILIAQGLAVTPTVFVGCDFLLDIASTNAFLAAGFSPAGPFALTAAGGLLVPAPIPTIGLAGFSFDTQAVAFGPPPILISNALTLNIE